MIRVVGTAGHVDHGKSTLVHALTGTHPDRLREEREREMTIDLGFAWMDLPGGIEVGFVDVPGHRDFMDNMLAGVGGFDAAMLVVAADEGVMPQTREHLAILDLLEIPAIVVVVTKCDLIDDPSWLGLVQSEIREVLAQTKFAGAPVVPISAARGDGLEGLRTMLERLLQSAPARSDRGRPRLPIDRAFTMTGFGTVVTGTLIDGTLSVGDEIAILPGGERARIRGLQTHRRSVAQAQPGSRVAANISGVNVQQVGRGDVLCYPDTYRASRMIDTRVRVLADAPVGIRHDQSVKLHLGTADVTARARVLMGDEIRPGQEGWVQFVLDAPLTAAAGDRLILRRPAPPATLAGGQVVDANPPRRHRRRDPKSLKSLERRLAGSAEDRILERLQTDGPLSVAALASRMEQTTETLEPVLRELMSRGEVRGLGTPPGQLYVASTWWTTLEGSARQVLHEYHDKFPLRTGMPREDFRQRIRLDPKQTDTVLGLLTKDGIVVVEGPRLRLAVFAPRLGDSEHVAANALAERFEAAPFSPPSVREAVEQVGLEAWNLLVDERVYVQVSDDVAFAAPVYDRLVTDIVESLHAGESVTVATVRNRYSTTRKYALALLEHLDATGVTVRVGDERRRGSAAVGGSQSPAR